MYQYVILVFLGLAAPGFGKLPKPTNVTIDSLNLKNILRWNSPAGFTEDEDVTYTVQYKLNYKNVKMYNDVCVTRYLHCDLTLLTYEFHARVQAAVGDKHSDWVTIQFEPYSQTVIGPPEIHVSSRFGYLDISISGPYLQSNRENGSIKQKYGEILYRLQYWKEDDPANVLAVNTSQSSETLTNLEPRTSYCLKVQVYIPEFDKEGQFSEVICEKTTDNGKVPWWQIAVAFLIMMLITMSVTLGLCIFSFTAYKRYTAFPSYSIPEHLKEYLSKPFNSTLNLPIQPSEEGGESCEQLTFLSEESEETKEKTNESA